MRMPIYLDYNATTPHAPEVIESMRPFLEEVFGNPSSSHWFGDKPQKAVMTARAQVAGLLNCQSDEIVFTSGGTEANNHAIIGIANARREKGNHIITSQIEHPAVLEVCKHLEKSGFEITYLEVDDQGLVARDRVGLSELLEKGGDLRLEALPEELVLDVRQVLVRLDDMTRLAFEVARVERLDVAIG